MDLVSANYIDNMLEGFEDTRRLGDGEMYLVLGDCTRVLVKAIGLLELVFSGNVLHLLDCFYVPAVHGNLILVQCIGRNGYTIILNNNILIKKDKLFMYYVTIMNGLCFSFPNNCNINNSKVEKSK